MFEDCNNPHPTPCERQFNSQLTVQTSAGLVKSLTKLNQTNAEFELDVDEFVLDQVVKEALDGGYQELVLDEREEIPEKYPVASQESFI